MSTVNIESNANKAENGKIKVAKSKLSNFFVNNKFGGLPFAILYGIYLYFVVTNLILTDGTEEPSPIAESLKEKDSNA